MRRSVKKVIDYFEEHPPHLRVLLPYPMYKLLGQWMPYQCPGWNEEKERLGEYLGTAKSFVEMYTGNIYTQEDSVLKCQKIEPKFKHGLDRLGIKGEVKNIINFDLKCPK